MISTIKKYFAEKRLDYKQLIKDQIIAWMTMKMLEDDYYKYNVKMDTDSMFIISRTPKDRNFSSNFIIIRLKKSEDRQFEIEFFFEHKQRGSIIFLSDSEREDLKQEREKEINMEKIIETIYKEKYGPKSIIFSVWFKDMFVFDNLKSMYSFIKDIVQKV